MKTFHIEIIKPSHYDKDGYVIQWWKAWIPSNSMACLYAIAQDCAERKVLGEDVTIEVAAHDEMNITVPVKRIAERISRPGHDGVSASSACSRTSTRAPWRSPGSSGRRASRSRSAASTSAAASRC